MPTSKTLIAVIGAALIAQGAWGTPRTVKVSFYRYAGCHEITADGEKSGYGHDFMEALAAKAGWTVEYVGYDQEWSDVLPSLDRGEIDIADFVGWTAARAENFGYSEHAMGFSGCSVRTLPENAERFRPGYYETWGKVRVGTMEGNQNEVEFELYAAERSIDYEILRYPDEDGAADALKRGEVDLVAFDGFATARGTYGL